MADIESQHVKTLVLGGGLAGLSTAFHIKGPVTLIEKSPVVGGTARSFQMKGFTFDYTGHLLHLHNPYTKQLIQKLLRGNLMLCQRKAWIYSHNTYTRYPFQANTWGLPHEIIRDCVLGFLEKPPAASSSSRPVDYSRVPFDVWCRITFGEGISKYFMLPYNEKLWQTPPRQMTADWCGPFVPTPSLTEVVKGALSEQSTQFGYNTSFFYPKKGGIQVLPEAIKARLHDVRTNCGLEEVDWRKRRARASTGEWFSYDHLVNTLPLPELLRRMKALPQSVQKALGNLRWTSVMCFNLGVARAHISEKSWVYFPEAQFPFYRVGFPMNFTPHVAPRDCSSMYVEVAYRPSQKPDPARLLKEVRRGLIMAKILTQKDRLPVAHALPIPYAYVIYNQERPRALATIFGFLKKNNIHSIGRYGAWKYSFMEEAILDGKKTAESINKLSE